MSETTFEEAYQVDESIRRARLILDERLRALTLASRFWKMSVVASREERLALAVELDAYGLFSLTALGKITRTHKGTLAKALPRRKRPGGRLEPEALTSLAALRKRAITGEPLSPSLMEELDATGTSISNVCRLVGVSAQSWYAKVNLSKKEAA